MKCRSLPCVPASAHRPLLGAALVCASVWLAGCATPQATRFHTLMTPPGAAGAEGPAQPARGPAWELLPVSIPAQVDRPQMVVQLADGVLAVVEQERWIAPLADEMQDAVAERLTEVLGVQESSGRSRRERWRVRIDVQRLDSALGRSARLEADWRVRSNEEPQRALRCRTSHEQPVAPGYAGLAAGHRKAVADLAETIAASLRALDAGQSPGCMAPSS
ncbi:MAG: membrane integrity-associated transporter subunit PqiC [Methylibium sp.]|uniref:PqiC family protein n=1 Tax=Methylibium sp. TaxID=2067992 RepID=UPI001823BBF1|nr:PqiC family protein [Methylibium sp.]MBA3598077.1 membrane integrity-associated transporter subunit PqiC [Methylibium sp.]